MVISFKSVKDKCANKMLIFTKIWYRGCDSREEVFTRPDQGTSNLQPEGELTSLSSSKKKKPVNARTSTGYRGEASSPGK